MTTINDVVLIYFEDNPVAFARIEEIIADHKQDWYHVTLLMLQLPLQKMTWILRDTYIEGETFTMGGKKMRLEKVIAPPSQTAQNGDEEDDVVQKTPDIKKGADDRESKKRSEKSQFSRKKTSPKVVSLQDRMKR